MVDQIAVAIVQALVPKAAAEFPVQFRESAVGPEQCTETLLFPSGERGAQLKLPPHQREHVDGDAGMEGPMWIEDFDNPFFEELLNGLKEFAKGRSR